MYIGLDIGTSGTKASLIQPDGTVLRNAQISYGFCNTRDGCRELDPKEVWKVVTECLKKAIKSKGLERSLKVSIPQEIYDTLTEEMEKLGK